MRLVELLELSVSIASDPASTTTPISVCNVADRLTCR
jgi:hypothetical protein